MCAESDVPDEYFSLLKYILWFLNRDLALFSAFSVSAIISSYPKSVSGIIVLLKISRIIFSTYSSV